MTKKNEDRIEELVAELEKQKAYKMDYKAAFSETITRVGELEAENARKTHKLKKLRNALSTYENKVQEYASDDWARSDPAYDWLNEDAGKTARAALMEDTDDE